MKQFDPLSHAGPSPSPCINVCHMDAGSGLCVGCARNIDEIMRWGGSTEAEKRAIWIAINHRSQRSTHTNETNS